MEIRPTFHDPLNLKNQKKNQMLKYFYMLWGIDAIKFFSLLKNFSFLGLSREPFEIQQWKKLKGFFLIFKFILNESNTGVTPQFGSKFWPRYYHFSDK